MKVAIVGSGMSGLTAGAYLIREGHEVTIYEQFSEIGGVTATIHKDGYSWDLGPMIVEGLVPWGKLGHILRELGMENKLKLMRGERGLKLLDFELISPKEYEGPEWRINKLKEVFPHESKALDQYYKFHNTVMKLLYLGNQLPFFKRLKTISTKIRLFVTFMRVKKYQDWTAKRLMDHFFTDEKIKMVFLGILADMVIKPSEFPAFGVAVFNPQTAYDRRLPYKYKRFKLPGFEFIENGCGELVKLFADYFETNGGIIKRNTKVTKFIIKEKKVKGMILEGGEKIDADIVLSSGGVLNTYYNLIGKEYLTEDLINHIDNIRFMESVIMVHVGIDFDPSPYQDQPLVYYYQTYDIEGTIAEMREGINHEGKHGFLIYILSQHSPEMAPPGKHALTVYTVAPNKLKEGEWTAHREELADKLLMEAEKYIPGLREHTQTRVIITPDDYKNRLNVLRHSFGGLAPKIDQENLPYYTSIENLYYIGQFSQSGAGVFGTAAGGREIAKIILKQKMGKAT
ncbi:MAG: NAD(P)/FAD-dependent oxidoreductase [Candidatus Lokiarchaeota archaeon]|nr:NAD(P)/FAD-dependent oxidoreductase [Candidatus Lokiarchaeota archaeon]